MRDKSIAQNKTVLVELHDRDTSVFLCTFFFGMSEGLPGVKAETEDRKKFRRIAGANFRRVYAGLSVGEKLSVRKQIAEFKNCPAAAVDSLIEDLTEIKGFLKGE